ncbi:hypothetical protein KSP35_22955 [Aquihabitans sp. G128]|uniref:hypothetical protein n=1 Tax=Aquihabitans sp. G128 TaxID=2849779 RepID=UPI001C23A033|nr:hypothetical protein [Aquihabitans sp. G128]QXC61134.1 hypothetical protein KSP35_22955 [Aquihabitans sp. G128]
MDRDGGARDDDRPGPLAALAHPDARRRFVVAPATGSAPEADGWVRYDDLASAAAVRVRRRTDPVAGLGIEELTAAMAFHAVAVPVVDLAVSLLVLGGPQVRLRGRRLWARSEGHAVTEVAVDPEAFGPAEPASADPDAAAADLVAVLGAAASLDEGDVALRWGAVADLVVVLALVAARRHGRDQQVVRAQADAVVAGLRARRPHPDRPPGALAVPGPTGDVLVLAHRSTCCQWHRAARALDAATVAEARCADCPSLDAATCTARLAALAADGGLGEP